MPYSRAAQPRLVVAPRLRRKRGQTQLERGDHVVPLVEKAHYEVRIPPGMWGRRAAGVPVRGDRQRKPNRVFVRTGQLSRDLLGHRRRQEI